jgi:guanylate cyclase
LPWFVAFGGLVAISAAIDPALANGAADMPNAVVVTFFALNILGTSTTAYALLTYFVRARERAHRALEAEQAKSERLLLNVLPKPVAARLKEREGIIADDFPAATVLFADIVGFTPLSERLSAADLVSLLDRVFASWDLPPRTASRRSRPSATRTWPLPAFQFPATTTPRPSPTWRLRWGPSWRGAPPN